MANTPSTIIEISSKHALPTEFSIMEEANVRRTQQWIANDEVFPSNFQKVVSLDMCQKQFSVILII